MSTLRLFIPTVALCALGISGMSSCKRAPSPASGSSAVRTPTATTIVRTAALERTPCYGTCPVYKVTLQSDGNVRYEGVRNVRVGGVQTWRVPVESASAVFRFADSARFTDLGARYDFGDVGCAPFIAELPGFVVTLATADSAKRVDVNQGCANIPRVLTALASLIDRVARSDSSLAGRP